MNPVLAVAGRSGGAAVGRGRRFLAVAVVSAPLLVLSILATGGWWLPLLLVGTAGLITWSLADVRSAFVVGVLLATFVDYNTGRLTVQLAIVGSWFAWTCLVLLWRSAWKGVVRPPAELGPGLVVWVAVCAFGVAHGLLRGNAIRNIGLELAPALWPLMALGMIQAYGRRSLVYPALGLTAIGLLHVGFGLTMLQVHQQRLSGIYFTPVTGIVAVGLWTGALLAPVRRIRALCLVGMAPMLAHLLFSFTRGYWLGFLVGIGVATSLAWRSLGRFDPTVRARRLLLVPLLAVVAAGTLGLSALYFGPGDLLSAIGGRFGSAFSTEFSGETVSNVIRLDEYDRAIAAAAQSPVIGRGLGFRFMTRDVLSRAIKDQWFVHNYYLFLWLKLGIAGVAAFGFLLWSFVKAARRAAAAEPSWIARAWTIATIAVTAQVAVILITNYSLADVNTASVMAFVWGIFWSLRADMGAPAARAEEGRP